MSRFFVERLDRQGNPTGKVDEVDGFIFKNRQKVVHDNGSPRYGETFLVQGDGGTIETSMHCSEGMLCSFVRLLGLDKQCGVTHFCEEPETVRIQKRQDGPVSLYNQKEKTFWKQAKQV